MLKIRIWEKLSWIASQNAAATGISRASVCTERIMLLQ
jgi:hypothetical protein